VRQKKERLQVQMRGISGGGTEENLVWMMFLHVVNSTKLGFVVVMAMYESLPQFSCINKLGTSSCLRLRVCDYEDQRWGQGLMR
jgi:hypothetical protein